MKVNIEAEVKTSRGMAGTTSHTTIRIDADDAKTYGIANNPPLPKNHIETIFSEARKSTVAALEAKRPT